MNELWALDGSNGQSSVYGFYDINSDNYVDLHVSESYYPSYPSYSPYIALPRILNGNGTFAEIYDGNPSSITNYQKTLNYGFAPSPSKGLSPADIDGDAIPDWLETESLVDGFGNTTTHLRLLRSSDGAVSWDSGPLPTSSISVGAADMSGGPAYEFYYTYSPHAATWTTEALVLDGVSKAALWTRSLPRFSYLNTLDLTGDGKAELLVNTSFVYTSGGNFQAFQGTNAYTMLWEANPGGLDQSFQVETSWDDGQDLDEDWEALDMDGDGDRDLVAVTNHYDLPSYPSRLHLRNATTFASDYVFPDLPNSSVDVQVEQIDGDPAYEIILSIGYSSGVTSTVMVYDAATKALEWSYAAPAPMGRASVGAFMDFNGDGTLDLTVGETGQNLLTSLSKARVYDAKNGYSLLYDSNPTNVIGFSSSFIGALVADGGDFWRLADLGNTGTLKFVQSDFFEGSITSRVIEVPGYTEVWNGGPRPTSSGLLAMLADVHPGAGFELIHTYSSAALPPSTYHTRVYGCGGPPLTPSPTRTPAPPSATPSRTPTVTRTFTPLPGSPTDSPTQSPSFTPSPSFTVSPTLTPSATPSATPTVSPTPSISPTVSATFTITPTFTPALYDASAGALAQLKPVFNPIRGDVLELYVELGAPAEAMDVELYSPAMVLLKRERFSLALAGARSRHRIKTSGLAGGPFFARVAVQNAKGEAGHRVLRLYKVP